MQPRIPSFQIHAFLQSFLHEQEILYWFCRLWLFAKIVFKKIASLLARINYFLKTFSGKMLMQFNLFYFPVFFILWSTVLSFYVTLWQKPTLSWFLVIFGEKKSENVLFSNSIGSKLILRNSKSKTLKYTYAL